MRKIILLITVVSLFTSFIAYADELQDEAKKLFKPIPTKIVEFKHNPSNKDKLLLGRMLFFEPRISASQLISCHTCHNSGMGYTDAQAISIGHAWQVGDANAPTILNSVFSVAQFWDGRSSNLMEQAKEPIQEDVEMNATPEYVIEVLSSMPEYVELFKKAFPNEGTDFLSFNNVARAIEVFEATIVTPNSKFDKFLKGDAKALNAEERAGLKAFIDSGCASCHNGVNIGGHGFSNIDKYIETVKAGKPDNRYKFSATRFHRADDDLIKVPSLRNIDLTTPYFRTGSEWSLKKAIGHMSKEVTGKVVNEKDIDAIYKFLLTTNGDMPKLEHPILPKSTDATPKPFLAKGARK